MQDDQQEKLIHENLSKVIQYTLPSTLHLKEDGLPN